MVVKSYGITPQGLLSWRNRAGITAALMSNRFGKDNPGLAR